MDRTRSLARFIAYLQFIFCILITAQHAVELAKKDSYHPNDPSTEWVKEVYHLPGLFWTLLLLETSRLIIGIILIYSVHAEESFLVYIWMIIMTVYVMFIFVVMPLIFAWYRYSILVHNLVISWFAFPFYCVSIYVMMLFYIEIQQ